ncbi:Uu.00g000920.m01.CDS01 [Anthostomella pinea]|uniref:Uu.00g000920.m01.CDS01 n=1 Tax=Anthostomella pinea TaxID=933095 RepID=A0AAI8VDZ5_9PEZI|nr:Uu.00g000920.m01.CDS01 [Anthostomella pinea]
MRVQMGLCGLFEYIQKNFFSPSSKGSAEHPVEVPHFVKEEMLDARPHLPHDAQLGYIEFSDMGTFKAAFKAWTSNGIVDYFDFHCEKIGIPWKWWTSYWVEEDTDEKWPDYRPSDDE